MYNTNNILSKTKGARNNTTDENQHYEKKVNLHYHDHFVKVAKKEIHVGDLRIDYRVIDNIIRRSLC